MLTVGFVDVFGGAMHLLGQPCGGAALAGKFGFKALAEMEVGWGWWCFRFHGAGRLGDDFRPCLHTMKKGAHLSFECLFLLRASGKPVGK